MVPRCWTTRIGLLVTVTFLFREFLQVRRHRRDAQIHLQRSSMSNEFEQSSDGQETPSLRSWSSQTTVIQRDSLSMSTLLYYYYG